MLKLLTIIKNYITVISNHTVFLSLCLLVLSSCSERLNNKELQENNNPNNKIIHNSDNKSTFQYLALGDSYTIGEAVPEGKSFPLQLATQLNNQFNVAVQTKIIATTGWRTDQLIKAVEDENITEVYDFVTLLIGVNNQFQNKDFTQYESEFLDLLQISEALTGNDKNKVLVLSIPDYGFTPFGDGKNGISDDIDKYNAYAERVTTQKGITFLNITDITRRGLMEPDLVAKDNLHVSALGYTEFVSRIMASKFTD